MASTPSASRSACSMRACRVAGGVGLVGGGLEVAHQPAERAPEVMGEAVGDGAKVAHQRLDAVEHGVQRRREMVELVAGAAQRHPAVERAGHDRAGGAVDLGDPAAHQPRQEPAGGERRAARSPPAPRAAPGRASGRRRRAPPRRGRPAAARPAASAAPAPRSRSAASDRCGRARASSSRHRAPRVGGQLLRLPAMPPAASGRPGGRPRRGRAGWRAAGRSRRPAPRRRRGRSRRPARAISASTTARCSASMTPPTCQ